MAPCTKVKDSLPDSDEEKWIWVKNGSKEFLDRAYCNCGISGLRSDKKWWKNGFLIPSSWYVIAWANIEKPGPFRE